MRLDPGGVLQQPIEKFAARSGGAAVEAKGEFVAGVVQMVVTHGTLGVVNNQRLSSEKTRCTRGSTVRWSSGAALWGLDGACNPWPSSCDNPTSHR